MDRASWVEEVVTIQREFQAKFETVEQGEMLPAYVGFKSWECFSLVAYYLLIVQYTVIWSTVAFIPLERLPMVPTTTAYFILYHFGNFFLGGDGKSNISLGFWTTCPQLGVGGNRLRNHLYKPQSMSKQVQAISNTYLNPCDWLCTLHKSSVCVTVKPHSVQEETSKLKKNSIFKNGNIKFQPFFSKFQVKYWLTGDTGMK